MREYDRRGRFDTHELITRFKQMLGEWMALNYIFEPSPGPLGTGDAPDLLYWVSHNLEAGTNFLLIDLKHTTQVDSSGLGTLMIACNRVRRVGGTLALCSLHPDVQLQIERAGLIDKFDVYADRQEFESFVSGDDDLHRYAL